MAHLERVVVLIDMDCFYCQVEEKLNPSIKGKPIAVCQYNTFAGGGIIAVNYVARDFGVTRHMRGDEAKKKCPEIEICRVPNVRGKADLTKYRDAGKDVADVLQNFTQLLERASVDEAYLDITDSVNERITDLHGEINIDQLPNTYVVESSMQDFIYGIYNNEEEYTEANLKLAVGGIIVEEIRKKVFEDTSFKCSAGIAHNKILAKLACGINKPNKQTILPHQKINELYKTLPIKKIQSLGGKFGDSLSEDLKVTFMAELEKYTLKELQQKYDEKNGMWLYNIARGIDLKPVVTHLFSKSIGCCKRFPGRTRLETMEQVKHWLGELASEVAERLSKDLENNQRKATSMVTSYTLKIKEKSVTSSRSRQLSSYSAVKITEDALEVIRKGNVIVNESGFKYPVLFLGISVGKFENCKGEKNIANFFTKSKKCDSEVNSDENFEEMVEKIDGFKGETESHCNEGSFFAQYLLNKNAEINEVIDAKENKSQENKEIIQENQLSDYQLALKIAKEQKHKISDPETVKVKPQSKVQNTRTTIENFFGKSIGDDLNENELIICELCKKKISIDKLDEHSDYHEAKKLFKELNGVKENQENVSKVQPVGKRKRENSAGENDKKQKGINAYFQKR